MLLHDAARTLRPAQQEPEHTFKAAASHVHLAFPSRLSVRAAVSSDQSELTRSQPHKCTAAPTWNAASSGVRSPVLPGSRLPSSNSENKRDGHPAPTAPPATGVTEWD